MERKRGEHGHYATEINAQEALDVFEDQTDLARPIGVKDVVDALGWSRGTVHNKLDVLVEEGHLDTRKIGRSKVWWIPHRRGSGARPLQVNDQKNTIPTTPDEVLEIAGTDIPGRTDEIQEKRAEIVLSAYKFLQSRATPHEQGRASAREIQNHVQGQYTENMDSDRQWVNFIRDGLGSLPGVEQPVAATGVWSYIDPNSPLAHTLDMEEIDDWIVEFDLQGDEESIERRKAMIQMAYDYLKKEGEAKQADFERVLPAYRAHYSDFSGLWSYCIRDALQDAPGAIPPGPGFTSWRMEDEEDHLSDELARELDVDFDDWVMDIEISGDDRTIEHQRALIQIAYDYLKEQGSARRSDFEQVLPDYTAHYTDFDGIWTYTIKKGLKEAPGVKSPKRGHVTWEFNHEEAVS